jgi:hypothetical protein
VLSLATCACFTAATAQAFFEEGNDHPSKLGYLKCSKWGDMTKASMNGCNPWPDNDSSYTFKATRDMKKNSVHYNATQALAAAAGFDRCAAYIIALYDEATDVATDYDQDLWLPFPKGVDPSGACGQMLADEGVTVVASPITGQLGGLVSPDFTYRSFGATQGNEVNRESFTFHWNHADVDSGIGHQCSGGSDAGPAQPMQAGGSGPFSNMVTLPELRSWAESSLDPNFWDNPLNSCTDSSSALGPIGSYDPLADPAPGSNGAFGVFLHSAQDYWSHSTCEAVTHGFGLLANDPCGFPSGHYAGEFGTINGKPANGSTTLSTPVSKYRIALHSANTVEALNETYRLLKEYLALHPELARPGAVQCSEAVINQFSTSLASIANLVPSSGKPSGAKKRSDLADSLFASNDCSYTVP